jgi:predicted TIM-barrel fold metal-dependent hydrolase
MRIVTLEEHFTTPEVLRATEHLRPAPTGRMAQLQPMLLDLGENRIAAMDAGGIEMQVLSLNVSELDKLSPADETLIARDVNDRLAEAVRAYPDRFAGFGTLGLLEPHQVGRELERVTRQLGFPGAMINGTVNGVFLDDARFTPFWEAANALEVPIYLHPAPPPAAVQQAYYSGLQGDLGNMRSIAGWGWHTELGLHVLRLIVSGLFDRFPALRIIIGHMGEDLPFSLVRAATVLQHAASKYLEQPVEDYFHRHFWVTTSGYFTLPPFRCAQEVVGLDRLLFSIDYPYSSNERGRAFLDSLPLSGDEREAFAHGNADHLLGLVAQ